MAGLSAGLCPDQNGRDGPGGAGHQGAASGIQPERARKELRRQPADHRCARSPAVARFHPRVAHRRLRRGLHGGGGPGGGSHPQPVSDEHLAAAGQRGAPAQADESGIVAQDHARDDDDLRQCAHGAGAGGPHRGGRAAGVSILGTARRAAGADRHEGHRARTPRPAKSRRRKTNSAPLLCPIPPRRPASRREARARCGSARF